MCAESSRPMHFARFVQKRRERDAIKHDVPAAPRVLRSRHRRLVRKPCGSRRVAYWKQLYRVGIRIMVLMCGCRRRLALLSGERHCGHEHCGEGESEEID